MCYKIEATVELAQRIKAAGFRVFLAKRATYGFYTDAEGSRVVGFQYDLGGFSFTGNYQTSQPRSTGTGWQLTASSDFSAMFKQFAPQWALRGASWRFTTLAEHLAMYQASSQFVEV
jgi:hypothetical protein